MIEQITEVIEKLKEKNIMNINKLLINNSDGQPSVTMTAFCLGFVIVNLKLILSGVTIAGLTITAFTGTEYAAAIAALGSIYVLRRQNIAKESGNGDETNK